MASGSSGGGGGQSSWRAEDLLDLERCGLAADLASTNLSSGGSVQSGWGQLSYGGGPELAYDMTDVLDKLLADDELPLLCDSAHQMATPSDPSNGEVECREDFEVVLKAPSALGIKTEYEKVTYLNRGYSYEIQLKKHSGGNPTLYKSTLSLTFCELRWRNGEKEHFERWSKDHPCDRLLEIDSIACDGIMEEDSSSSAVHFTWVISSLSDVAVVAIKLNCLSTEFAAKKHGGERGVPLRLVMELVCEDGTKVYQGGCGIKVFKDKGGDRKQRQDQLKLEKISLEEQGRFHLPDNITRFTTLPLSDTLSSSSLTSTPYACKSDNSISLTPGASPYSLATPPQCIPPPTIVTSLGVMATMSVEETQRWLMLNRFGYCSSMFCNYAGEDMFRLSRKDLMDLCGHGDGIRLFNSLRTHTLKTLYICSLEQDKVYQAVYLEELSAESLLLKLLGKLGDLNLTLNDISAFLRLTSRGFLVAVDNAVVHSLNDEQNFILFTIKEENGLYKVILRDHTPLDCGDNMCVSVSGSVPRHTS